VSTAQDLPLDEGAARYGTPLPSSAPLLRLVPTEPLDFDDAVKRLRPRLQRYAVRRLGDPHEAEELVQEALLRAYTHREQLLTEEDLSAWSTVVTGRLVIDRLRVRGRSTSVADVPEGYRVSRDTADIVVAKDEARTALDALDAMPTRQAALLWAREVEGHSYEELCVRFDMTEPAVRSVLTRARKALRKEYALRGGTLPVGGLAILAPWIVGLTRMEKLRRLATRATAPAALGAVAITTLGGLILSPFGIGAIGPDKTFSPTPAVVSAAATHPASHTPQMLLSARPVRLTLSHGGQGLPHHAANAPTRRGNSYGGTIAPFQGIGCSPRHGAIATAVQGTPLEGVGVSGARCTDRATELQLLDTLPENPTGIRDFGVSSNALDCPTLPSTPVSHCTDPTPHGAQK
jgi:RNA polymerase sigma factor (sigma-70 family)